ncbi:MAG: EAL domain-containing protein [Paraglaciecola sp.]|uniref:putative bifunctional diguanylate cyclase/phosphodiesterase n=1 Tax=Paraglaciecola sp. TaxID=1920173 RepID=UPI00273F19C8|nr:EAL domain-containing protein [Paraglaciecola sp.]MDP5029347.1 EAL domain-containing protein [Paraglaciecola sp.]MDP5133462.1 EAL domain-containing protein [Paraglaciecola sp.]
MISSVKVPLILIIVITTLSVALFSLTISINQHEILYRESVKSDLDGLSENLSNDLVSVLVSSDNEIELDTILLRLDRYENVKFAHIFTVDGERLSSYFGKSGQPNQTENKPSLANFLDIYSIGMTIERSQLIAFKVIGDTRLAQGYLVIVNDLNKPLEKSKRQMLEKISPLLILIVTVALLGLYLFLNRLLSPLSELSQFANEVKRTHDYSLKPNINGKYEVAELSDDIGHMMDAINAEVERNKDYTMRLLSQQKAMEKLANFDSLTGLPNRQFFVELLRVEIARAKRVDSDVALLFFDLDGFKDVNDAFGHEVGDKLLIKIAERVKSYLRDGDVISRLGGDEFLIMLHNNPNEYVMTDIAQRIVNGLSETIKIEEWQINVGASIGIAKASQSNFNLSEFISNADLAMYRSKLEGKNRYTIFVESMMEDNKRKLLIAKNIDEALAHDKFTLFYQPKVDEKAIVKGFEVLLRWHDKELGFISPAEFIPIAENCGKINSITSWVLRQMCIEFTELQSTQIEHVRLAVNLSAIDIKNETLFTEISQLLEDYDINPKWIEFEVTESAYLENLDIANGFFAKLHELGATIALDDFGTGYSSLAYLTQINLDTLKIDKQFVDNLGVSERSSLITTTVIDMASKLNLQVCAEGVETREQADYLIDHGCHLLQGYLFGRPVSLEDVKKAALLN